MIVRLGVCIPSETTGAWLTKGGAGQAVGALVEAGAEFVELALTAVFKEGRNPAPIPALEGLGLPVEAFYKAMPADLRLVGPEGDRGRGDVYFRHAFVQAGMIARGSGGSGAVAVLEGGAGWRMPEDFAKEEAEQQLLWVLHRAADHARSGGLRVGLMPGSRRETNLINSVAEAVAMAERLRRAELGIAVRLGQVEGAEEWLKDIGTAGERLLHVQVVGGEGWGAGEWGKGMETICAALREAGYAGRVSLQCEWREFGVEAPKAVASAKEVVNRWQR